jgi:hypothetical protein
MAKKEFANAKMERAVPGNLGKKLKNPHVAMIPNRGRESVKKPTLDAKWNIAPEINLYGP